MSHTHTHTNIERIIIAGISIQNKKKEIFSCIRGECVKNGEKRTTRRKKKKNFWNEKEENCAFKE